VEKLHKLKKLKFLEHCLNALVTSPFFWSRIVWSYTCLVEKREADVKNMEQSRYQTEP